MGASSIFLKIPGVVGDATDPGHRGWIKLLSISCQRKRDLSMPVETDEAFAFAGPATSEVELEKDKDVASNGLMRKFLREERQDITVDFVSRAVYPEIYYRIHLAGALIKGFRTQSDDRSSRGNPTEILILEFSELRMLSLRSDSDLSLMALFGLPV
jgi:type VI protein secretion system component Hcp